MAEPLFRMGRPAFVLSDPVNGSVDVLHVSIMGIRLGPEGWSYRVIGLNCPSPERLYDESEVCNSFEEATAAAELKLKESQGA